MKNSTKRILTVAIMVIMLLALSVSAFAVS